MLIGVPKEIKTNENRVALMPVGGELLKAHAYEIWVEPNAGYGSGFFDDDYKRGDVKVVAAPAKIRGVANIIVNEKGPHPELKASVIICEALSMAKRCACPLPRGNIDGG